MLDQSSLLTGLVAGAVIPPPSYSAGNANKPNRHTSAQQSPALAGLDRYQIKMQLAAVDAYTAYEAFDLRKRESVELRMLRATDSNSSLSLSSSLQLAGSQSRLPARLRLVELTRHAAIVRPIDSSLESAPVWFVVNPVAAHTLADLDRDLPWPNLHARLIIANQLTQAIADAHRVGLIHGRLRPSTIRITDNLTPQIDFVSADNQWSKSGNESTELMYYAPELLMQSSAAHVSLDRAVDIFSLGRLIAWLAIADEADATEQSSSESSEVESARPSAAVQAALLQLTRQCLCRDSSDRPSAQSVATRFDYLIAEFLSPKHLSNAAGHSAKPNDTVLVDEFLQGLLSEEAKVGVKDEAPSSDGQNQIGDADNNRTKQVIPSDDIAAPEIAENETTRFDDHAPSSFVESTAVGASELIQSGGTHNSVAQLFAAPLNSGSDTNHLHKGRRPAGTRPVREPAVGEVLGRFRILQKVGQGGMGAVFKAEDIATGQIVALKTLNLAAAGRASALQRFQKEARLLAAVNNPYVTRLIEVNEDSGIHFLAMEFAAGTDLKKVLKTRGPLDEPQAVSIVADIARALVDAHQRGIVHRDVKPENVLLLDVELPESIAGGESTRMDWLLSRPRVKLTDFGVARQVLQSESLAMTQVGAVIGTPLYMAPEQCKGQRDITPATDVYAIGVTLFELLAGRPPFQSDDAMKIATMHCLEPIPKLQRFAASASDAVVQIVEKAMAKRPADRYANASHLLADLERLLRGESTHLSVHPVVPTHDPRKLFQAEFVWNLTSTPEELWPYVSNTERLNRAAGLPSVVFETINDPQLGMRRFGSFKLAGLTIAWEEHPFDWVEGRRMGVLREFTRGPFKWFANTVELISLAGGGAQLRHCVRIQPRNLVGRAVAAMEVGLKGRRSLDKIYRRIDSVISGRLGGSSTVDAFQTPAALARDQRERLHQRGLRLIERGVDAEIVESLSGYLADASAQDVARIRPLALAHKLQLPETKFLSACLLAATEGLLTLQWDILCPTCRIPSADKDTLREIEKHSRCEACNVAFELDLSKSVELVCRAHPEIRTTDGGTYCIGGPAHSPHVVAQMRLQANERIELELSLEAGDYILRSPQMSQSAILHIQCADLPSQIDLRLTAKSDPRTVIALKNGKQVLMLTNEYDVPVVVRIERTIQRGDVVSAAQISALAEFRELFPNQQLQSGQLMTVAQIAFLVTAVDDLNRLCVERGDTAAYEILRSHYRTVEALTRKHGGTIVKYLADGTLAAFDNVEPAVATALSLVTNPALSTDEPYAIRAGVHRGAVMMTTLNDRLDYFGATVHAALSLPHSARPDELVLSENVSSDPAVNRQLVESGRTLETVTIGGTNAHQELGRRIRFGLRADCNA